MHNNNHFMSMPILILFISLTLSFLPLSFSTPYIHSLNKGSSLSVEKPDQVLISPKGVFSAGFHSVGDNAYCFAIWFSEPLYDGSHTIVWMANRDQPINGRLSKLCLLQNGNLILTDAGQLNVWATGTESISSAQLLLNDTGNLVLLTLEGHFKSTDNFEFTAVDSGIGTQKRLTMDYDGNIRLYSLDKIGKIWSVSWQAIQKPCNIHGYKIKSHTDQSLGYEPEFSLSCSDGEAGFLELPHVEFYGYDITFYSNYTFKMCEEKCLQRCFPDPMYIKLPKVTLKSYTNHVQGFSSDCPRPVSLQRNRTYKKPQENETLQFLVWFASAIGGVEIICVCLVFCFLYRTRPDSVATTQSYLQIATGFRKFTYSELKQATHNFGEEIGRGGGGIVYKGVLSDHRIAAIKQLNDANQGEAEFLAEASTIGRVNHKNLIEVWGYCAEGKHRLLVYEYMEHGSLAENLATNTLDWVKRFDIAVGSAKGLAYLHEECLEWVLHCDVKPQNILLDSNYHPKVADFGLSKLLNRGGGHNSSFSKVRGTRGYMAPEWIFNHRITSKVDVYSYGVVVLEMVTGKSPLTNSPSSGNSGDMEQRHLVKWVREKMNETVAKESWLEEIIDPVMKGRYDASKMEILVGVALQCVEENKDARRTMSQVIQRLVHHEPSDY
ncbi:hypothetical protein TEA_017108 [Camellia sinensis var. sinensis]|uniref:non-specific serine/threonine protein kinase n=1 Tax=Camellia sinensis var. sinensis TaxID=542762 RepID=A0A4S4D9T8_CAMSN|nr:hypothetical protein TEA_017108 [Camellia sinensis var. sinensis]